MQWAWGKDLNSFKNEEGDIMVWGILKKKNLLYIEYQIFGGVPVVSFFI